MKYEKYNFKVDKRFVSFEFTSVGPKGKIIKVIQFTEIDQKGVFNLGFGDKHRFLDKIDDATIYQ